MLTEEEYKKVYGDDLPDFFIEGLAKEKRLKKFEEDLGKLGFKMKTDLFGFIDGQGYLHIEHTIITAYSFTITIKKDFTTITGWCMPDKDAPLGVRWSREEIPLDKYLESMKLLVQKAIEKLSEMVNSKLETQNSKRKP